MIKPFRKYIEMKDYENGMEDGWETLSGITKLDRIYIKGLVKKYCGRGLMGKTFRFAYKDIEEGRMWIKFKFDK